MEDLERPYLERFRIWKGEAERSSLVVPSLAIPESIHIYLLATLNLQDIYYSP